MKTLFISFFAALIGAFVAVTFLTENNPTRTAATLAEPAYERVISSNTLRCGYNPWHPVLYQDPKTGEMSGLFAKLMTELARISKINLEWTSVIDWGQIATALETGKVDAFCAGMWNDSVRGKHLAYTRPFFSMAANVFVRADDSRFPDTILSLADIDLPEYAAAYNDGDVIESIVAAELPNVRGVSMPSLAGVSENIQHLLTGKSDLYINPTVAVLGYEEHNGTGEIRQLKLATPLRAYGNVLAVHIGEHKLHKFLNSAVTELINSGRYHQIMTNYLNQYPGGFIPANRAP